MIKYITEYMRQWRKKNPNYSKQYRQTHKEQMKLSEKKWRQNHPGYNKNWEKRKKEWAKQNPRSSKHFSLELQTAMNNVRIRDNNTCQWQNCSLTHRQAPIHVHHIFPKSEYPELELIEQFMICYCANHHGLWHRYRGDNYYHLIL